MARQTPVWGAKRCVRSGVPAVVCPQDERCVRSDVSTKEKERQEPSGSAEQPSRRAKRLTKHFRPGGWLLTCHGVTVGSLP